MSKKIAHSVLDDVQAMIIGPLFVALGVTLFTKAKLVTGGTAGVAFITHYMTDVSFGTIFFLLNIPFYWLALRRMGKRFVVKTVIAVGLLSILCSVLPKFFVVDVLNPIYAAIMGGLLIGVGFLILFRHGASLGGLNVLVLYLQDRYGWRAGTVQLTLDAVILLLSSPIISPKMVGISLLGALSLNLLLIVNHRPGRYQTT